MLKHVRPIIPVIMFAFVLTVGMPPSIRAAQVPSGVVAVFPDKEPVRDDDLGSPGSGSVDDDNSNLTIDFGFYLPTPTPTPTSPPPTFQPGGASSEPPSADVSGLSLSKSVNRDSATPGQTVEYTVTVTNSSDLPVHHVTVQDRLPEGFSYIPGSATINGRSVPDPFGSDRSLRFLIDEIPAHTTVTLRYSVTIAANIAAGRYENFVNIVGGPEASANVRIAANRRTGNEHFGKFREGVDIFPPCVVIPAEIEDPWFITDIAMYAASELHETSRPFIQWSEENGLALDQYFFSPTGVREFGVEILEFSVDNVNTVLTNSGIGLHLKYAPFLVAGSHARGMSPEAYLQERLQDYARRSNLKVVPQNIYPIFVEYAEGNPRYTQAVNINDWKTLLWDRQSFNTHFIPSAYGQALLRQVLLLEDFLATRHDQNGTPHPDGAFLGVDDARGFIGILTAESVVNKLWFMANTLLYNKNREGIPYFPYQTVVTPASLADGHPTAEAVDRHSRLFDQLSLLWALSELMLLTDADSPTASRQVFSQDLLAPDIDFLAFEQSLPVSVDDLSAESIHALAKELAGIVFSTITTFHYNEHEQTLLDEVLPGRQEDEEADRSPKIVTTYLGLTIPALKRYYEATEDGSEVRNDILNMVRIAADSLLKHLADQKNGGFWPDKVVTSQIPDDEGSRGSGTGPKNLQSHMAAIRGLLSAYALTQDVRYRRRAYETYDFLEKRFWTEDFAIYKDREQRGLYTYTPMDIGVTAGALRELIYQSDNAEQMLEMTKRMRTFVKQIAKYAGLQLSEVITDSTQEYLQPAGEASSIRTAISLDSPFGLAPVFGSEVALNNKAILALHAEQPTDSCDQSRSSFRSTYYYTDIGMYAASEFGMTLKKLHANGASEASEPLERNRNPELLNLTAIERITQKASDFSDYNLVHIQTKSGLGIGLKYGPLVQQQAAVKNTSPDVYLEELMKQYAALTGLERFPDRLLPIFLEFEGGVPEIEYGGKSERWLDNNLDKSLILSALGQTLRRQVLWIKDVLAERHDDHNRVASDGAYWGRNAEEGFLGLLIAQEVANKVLFLNETLLTPPDSDVVSTPSGLYFPHRVEVGFDGDAPKHYSVKEQASSLFDQASLLWGLSEFYGLLTANPDAPYAEIFGTGKLIDQNFTSLTKKLITVVLENLETLNWNPKYQTFYDWNRFNDRQHTAEGATEAGHQYISTHLAAMVMIALESVFQNVSDDPALHRKAQAFLLGQVVFLQRYLYREADGAVYNGAALEDPATPSDGLKTLLAHAAAIRSFLIAFRTTGEPFYLHTARNVFEALDRSFWDPRLRVYKSSYNQYQYTPLNVAMTVGAFRELLALDTTTFLEQVNEHFSTFFEQVVERIGLQLSEQQHVMELAGEPQTLAPVFASDIMIQPAGSAAAGNIPQPGSTLLYVIKAMGPAAGCGAEEAYIEDTLPAGVTFLRSVPMPESINNRVLRWNVADLFLDEDGFYTIQLEVQVDPFSSLGSEADYRAIQTGNRTWSTKNCASLWCNDPNKGQHSVETDCVEDKLETPQLGIEKSVLTLGIEPGGDAEFKIVVTNMSEVTAYRVIISDVNPTGFIYLQDSVRSQDVARVDVVDIQPLVWGMDNLEPGQSFHLTYGVHLDSQLEEGVYQTRVNVYAMDRSGYQFSSNEFELAVDVGKIALVDISQAIIEPQDVSQIQAGQPFSIATSLENVGSEDLSNGRVVAVLPEGLEYVQDSSRINEVPVGNPEQEERKLLWKIGELAQGVTKTLRYSVKSSQAISQTLETVFQGDSETGQTLTSREQKFELPSAP